MSFDSRIYALFSGNIEEIIILSVGVSKGFTEKVSYELGLGRWKKFTRLRRVAGYPSKGKNMCRLQC